ncbi:hypothetical protein, partial [Brevundimonas sp.]|uniref:hypothetical protein n=1 Tax=Brevundimonas sp. TaxID=1871086 RepID=UPI0022C992B1
LAAVADDSDALAGEATRSLDGVGVDVRGRGWSREGVVARFARAAPRGGGGGAAGGGGGGAGTRRGPRRAPTGVFAKYAATVASAAQGAVTIPNPPPAQVFRPAATTTAREDA